MRGLELVAGGLRGLVRARSGSFLARARPGVGMYSARALDIDEGCARHLQPRALEFGRGAVGVPALALPNAAGAGVLAVPATTCHLQTRSSSASPWPPPHIPAAPSPPPRRPSS